MSSVSSSEFGGLIAVLVLVGAAFVALLVWLVADGVHDLPLSRRVHLRLDVVRFIAVAVLVIFAIGVALWTARHPGDESGEAIIFAVMAGVGAFTAKTGACGETSGPGLTTWIACDPTLAIALAGTLTVSWLRLT